jgi:exopolysaccharide biosynthesis polyprenyl glycosylphosphotransferase
MVCCLATVLSRQQRSLRPFVFAADLLLIWLAFELAYRTRSALPLKHVFFLTPSVHASVLLFTLAAWPMIGLWLGVYDRPLLEHPLSQAWRTVKHSLGLLVALVVFEYATRLDLSRPFLALLFCYAAILTALARLLVDWLAQRYWTRLAEPRHLYVAGTGAEARRIGALIEQSSRFGLRLDGFLGDAEGQLTLDRSSYPVYPISAFPERLKNAVVDEVIVAVEDSRLPQIEDLLEVCEEEGVQLRLSLDFFPHRRGSLSLERLGTTPLLTLSRTPSDEARLLLKRLTDLVLASLFLIVLSPLLALIALVIRVSSPGPVLFRQQRCGLNGRRFTLLKFRTMVPDAEQRQAELAHLNVKQVNFKIPNDPRQTGVGRWLRKFSLDELPQLWNVLRGQMSLVGPRPAIPAEVEQYKRWQRRRLRMRPGLTSLWAVQGRDALGFEKTMRLDLAYIDSWSLALDWSILLRTIPRVLTGKGAH